MSKYSNKMGIEFEGFDEAVKRLEKLEGDVRTVTEKALKQTHKIVTGYAEESAQKSNLPAKGKYSKGDTLNSLKREASVEWSGTEAKVPVGFDISKGGLASIFMIYGTPRYMKNKKMYDAFWSNKTHTEVLKAQEDVFYEEIGKLGG